MSENVVFETTGSCDDGGTVRFKIELKSTHFVLHQNNHAKGTDNLDQERVLFVSYKSVQRVHMSHEADEDGDFQIGMQLLSLSEKPLIGLISQRMNVAVSDYEQTKAIYRELLGRVTRAHATNGI